MSESPCKLCKRDVTKTSMARCTETKCPHKEGRKRAVPDVLIALGLLAVVIGGIIFIASRFVGERGDSTVSGSARRDQASAGASGRRVVHSVNGGAREWIGQLISGKPRQSFAEGHSDPASATGVALEDPRAATRVQTFSCSGALSASRATICTRWDLATTDYNLALAYKDVMARTRRPAALRKAYAIWREQLDALGGDPEALARHYREWREKLAQFT